MFWMFRWNISKCLKNRVCCMCHFGILFALNNAKRLHPFEFRSSIYFCFICSSQSERERTTFTYFFEMLHFRNIKLMMHISFTTFLCILSPFATNWATLNFIANYINFRLYRGQWIDEREKVCKIELQSCMDFTSSNWFIHCTTFYPLHLSIASLVMTSTTRKWKRSLYHLFSPTQNKNTQPTTVTSIYIYSKYEWRNVNVNVREQTNHFCLLNADESQQQQQQNIFQIY